jgi:hypothetical protein
MTSRCHLPLLIVTCCLTAGCVDGPFSQLAEWNPWYTQQWQKDEERGPTYHRRCEELQLLQSQATKLSPKEQAQYIDQLTRLVRDDSNPAIRAEATRTLSMFTNPAILPGMRMATTDSDPFVRIAACRVWGKIGGAEALQSLADRVTKDEVLDVRIRAATELGNFQDPAAVEALGTALNDHDPALQYQAMQSLKSCTGRDYGNNVASWREFVAGRTPPESTPSLAERMRAYF